jgi:hypothetical protein
MCQWQRNPGRNNIQGQGCPKAETALMARTQASIRNNEEKGRLTDSRMFSPGHKLRVSMYQRVTFAGACRPSELAELGGEVRCEL